MLAVVEDAFEVVEPPEAIVSVVAFVVTALPVNLVLAQAERAFEKAQQNGRARTDQKKDRRIEQLEAKIADKNDVIAELMEVNVRAKKRAWGTLNGAGVPRDTRDEIVDYITYWKARAEIPAK